MSQHDSGPMQPYNPGIFGGITNRVKLILRLMADGRVSLLLKLIPLASVVYLIFPDLAPGPVDDALLMWLSTYLFVELCPPDIVAEHQHLIDPAGSGAFDPTHPSGKPFNEEDIIEAEIVDKDTPEK